ncbi:MAG: nucleotidyltransferase family protein [Anaerolineales bacterium]|nr:nucleotidyltransferase family protein [Anaerolineales bacterium]
MAQVIARRKISLSKKISAPIGKKSAPKDRFIRLKSQVTPLLKPYAKRISVFGSYARGEATALSDIDLLIALKPVEARPSLGLFEFIALEQALAKKLGCDVDLVTEEDINPRRRKNIEKDKVVLYEAK